jgi:hypothetical protein
MPEPAARTEDRPLCPEGDVRFWSSAGGLALLASAVACMAGAPGLFPSRLAAQAAPDFLERLSAAGANVVWVLLCTGCGLLGFGAIALVRGRPAGSPVDIASRAFACVAMANLVHLVPVGIPALKLVFDGAAFFVASALLARSAFRIRGLDAFAAASVAVAAVAALAAAAGAVVWAVRPR